MRPQTASLPNCDRSPRNSGVDAGVVVDRMSNGKGSYGFDASKGTSVASVLLLTEATMTALPEPSPKVQPGSELESS